jgi:hypothetical protein
MNDLLTQKKVLFTDLRHILCSDLEWYSPTGEYLPLNSPPEPEVAAFAKKGLLPSGVEFFTQKAHKTEPLSLPLNGYKLGPRVIFENGLYKSWYLDAIYPKNMSFDAGKIKYPDSVSICYTESKDGYEWSLPKQSKLDIQGQTWFDGFTFFIDPAASSSERYKAVYMAYPSDEDWSAMLPKYEKFHPRHKDIRCELLGVRYCIYGAVSSDGIHWKPVRKPLMIHYSDTDTTVYYDSWLKKYVMYTRLYHHDRRIIGRAETDDFFNWGHVEPIIRTDLRDPLSIDIYTNGRTQYPGLPQYHFMFPMIYHRFTQTSEVRLFSSADGICWNQLPGGPVMSTGESDWDSEFIWAGKDLVPFGDNKIAVPFYGLPFPHKYPRWKSVLDSMRIAWAWWPCERLCGIKAEEDGEFFTVPMIPQGRHLKLNYCTSLGGEIRVGIMPNQEGQRQPFHVSHYAKRDCYIHERSITDCDSISGDELSRIVRWKGDPEIAIKDQAQIVLHFELRSAKIFGFEWV